jgi:hypothetical protein
LKVLKELNFKTYDPEVICVEILIYDIFDPKIREIEIKNNEIYKFLNLQNYKKIWSGSSYCSHIFIKC